MSITEDAPCAKSKDNQSSNDHAIEKHPDNVQINEIEDAGHTNHPLAKIIRKSA